jgi:hypothetical protein
MFNEMNPAAKKAIIPKLTGIIKNPLNSKYTEEERVYPLIKEIQSRIYNHAISKGINIQTPQ